MTGSNKSYRTSFDISLKIEKLCFGPFFSFQKYRLNAH
jgi:hypothetical protein